MSPPFSPRFPKWKRPWLPSDATQSDWESLRTADEAASEASGLATRQYEAPARWTLRTVLDVQRILAAQRRRQQRVSTEADQLNSLHSTRQVPRRRMATLMSNPELSQILQSGKRRFPAMENHFHHRRGVCPGQRSGGMAHNGSHDCESDILRDRARQARRTARHGDRNRQPGPINEITVGSELSGTAKEVFVDTNDQVSKGQPLARLDTSKLKQADAAAAPRGPQPKRRSSRHRPPSLKRRPIGMSRSSRKPAEAGFPHKPIWMSLSPRRKGPRPIF